MADDKFYYVVSYDFSTEHNDVELRFLELLKEKLSVMELGKSVYGITNDMGKQIMESCVKALLNKAFDVKEKEEEKEPNNRDKVYLLCNAQKVDYSVKDPESHKIYCYKLL